jgi:hypothetical protein
MWIFGNREDVPVRKGARSAPVAIGVGHRRLVLRDSRMSKRGASGLVRDMEKKGHKARMREFADGWAVYSAQV